MNVADGKTVTFNANVNATNTKIGAGSTLNLTDTKTITGTVTIGSGGTLAASNVASISGLINGVTAGSGTLALTSTKAQATNNAIGSTAGLAALTTSDGSKVTLGHNVTATKVTIGGGASGQATQTAGLITGALEIGAGATFTIAGGSGVTGTINATGAGASNSTLNINSAVTAATAVGTLAALETINVNSGGTLTLGGHVTATSTNVLGTGTLNFGSASRTITGNLTGAGATATMNLGSKAHTVTGTFTTGAANTIGVVINSGTGNDNGKITSTGNATIAAGTTISVDTSKASSFIASGTSYQVVSGTGAHTNAVTITDNSAVLNFTDTSTANNRTITANRVTTYQALATNVNAQGIGTVLTNLAASGTGTLATFQGALDNAASGSALTALIEQVTPQVEAGSIQAVQSVGQSLDVVSARLSNLRAGIDTSTTGMAAGGAVADRGVWVQAFGMTASQDRRGGISGFDVDTYGVAAGADTRVADHTRLGLSGSYGNTNLDGTGASRKTDIDSYQINLYGTHDMGKWFVDGLVGYAFQRYDSSRNITAAGVVANSDYDGHTYTLRANTGYRLDAGNGIQVIPNAGLTYFNNQIDGYTETGAGALNLTVRDTDAQSLFGRVGFDLAKEFESSGMIIRPTVRAAYLYDFLAEEAETTALFTGGGASFRVTDARPERNSFNLGASLNVMTTKSVTLSADYDYVGRSNYDAHSGMLRARFGF
ncbi:MAG: autotransporter domain-containing protein [Proteobacteria bacterium]|nr:autotransporter domain-containing protein [Pseudomonadota bacterium]